jgi:hypothetical protein
MKALYVYGVRPSQNDTWDISGAIQDSAVFAIPYRDIEAVVSEIDLDQISLTEINSKAKDDSQWIIQEATKHQLVLERALEETSGGLIPMHFGTIYKSKNNMKRMLKKRYEEFLSLLKHLTAKQEWAVKVYVDEESYTQRLKESPELSIQSQKVTKSVPGVDYFAGLEFQEQLQATREKQLNQESDRFFEILSGWATEARKTRPLDKEFVKLVGTEEQSGSMILNSAYLIDESQKSIFLQTLSDLRQQYPSFQFQDSGPWPAYNFVS